MGNQPTRRTAAQPRITLFPDDEHRLKALERDLRAALAGEVRFDAGSRALYATDASNYRQVPIAVVVPRTLDDVVRCVAVCARHDVPILSRGGGTSLAGQCCNAAVVMDFTKYLHHMSAIDAKGRTASVQPGIVLDVLNQHAVPHGLMVGPDPATHNHCTIGGMIGNDACGVHAQVAGRMADNVESLEILTYDGLRLRVGRTSDAELAAIIAEGGRKGEIYAGLKALRDRYATLIRERFPKIPRAVSGFALDSLLPEHGFNVARALVGTEGTCVTILQATVKLVDSYPGRALVVLGYPDVYVAADHIPQIREFAPIGLEGLDNKLVGFMEHKGLHTEHLGLLPKGDGLLIVEFGADTAEAALAQAKAMMGRLQALPDAPDMRLCLDPEDAQKIWELRESGLGATAFAPGMPDTWPGWEDSAVPPERLGDYLRELRALFDAYGYDASLYGHFGQGCVHCRINFELTSAEGIGHYRAFVEAATELVVRYGGSLSGEHGDGQARGELLERMFGSELVAAFREFKALWDPRGRMNPGKVVDPLPLDTQLRLGADYAPKQVETHFAYPDDEGAFSRAALRCVGVGKCRRLDGGTMCPSFMVTHEEKHTTRGRAHALFEMLQGDVLQDGWADEHVKETLALCLSCKGCKSDCPVNVDIATYKSEFLAHYHEHKRRPRVAFAFGFITYWARLASTLPHLANFVTQTPTLAAVAKAVAGVAPERALPKFATETFKHWFFKRPPRQVGTRRVLLWPDTFNNHFHPEVARDAVTVLEAAGFQVEVPRAALCCGRPLYEFGFLKQAKAWLGEIVETLRDDIRAGVPVVGLEPSCVSVFRDELRSFFPDDEDALRLSGQTLLLSEFLEAHAPGFEVPRLERPAIVHGHCHHKSILRFEDESAWLDRLGLKHRSPEGSCCGMAGSFGFEPGDKFDVAVAIGERALLPAVREASPETLVITDGFSCREQVAQGAGREGLHLAQVLALALRGEEPPAHQTRRGPTPVEMGLLALGLLGAGALALEWRRLR